MSVVLTEQFRSWVRGIPPELQFWEKWMETRGLQWPDDFASRYSGKQQLRPLICGELERSPPCVDHTYRILDVGSGPVSSLGRLYKGSPVELVSVDPLAPYYGQLAERCGLTCTVKQGFVEDLSSLFDEESFDLVHCSNALDHSFDPMRGIEEMLMLVKVGGSIILSHCVNEAEAENYEGFHQWNIEARGDDFVIWNREVIIVVNQRIAESADVKLLSENEGHWVTAIIQKKNKIELDRLSRLRARNQEVLSSLVAFFGESLNSAAQREEGCR